MGPPVAPPGATGRVALPFIQNVATALEKRSIIVSQLLQQW